MASPPAFRARQSSHHHQVEDVVVFEDVPQQYSPDQDLFVVYRLTKVQQPNSPYSILLVLYKQFA